ncbi:MAG: hypothetical protein J6X62_07530 [Bacteroidales bacterium]|nr:hypothetical protein [Bacteroidales bacterium]
MRIIIDYPWYCTLLCIAVGLLYSVVMYWWPRRADLERRVLWLASLLRFAAVTLLAFLFLSPLAKRSTNERENPVVVLLQDATRSVVACSDSSYYGGEYAEAMARTVDQLSKHYDVHCFTYGGDLQAHDDSDVEYTGKVTDMANALEEVKSRYAGRNVGAVVLTGDGIYNQGTDPVSAARGMTYPVYTVALGDTTTHSDAFIAHVRYNKVAYLGNRFPMEVTVRAVRMNGRKATLTVSRGGQTLYSKPLQYEGDNFAVTEPVTLQADKAGMQNYVISLSLNDGESSSRNNVRTVPIEVIDGHQKIAIVAAAPHPDVAALRRSIESNESYEVSTFLASDFKGPASQYNLIILHNLPGKRVPLPAELSPDKCSVPMLFVIGLQTDLPRFNALHTGMEVFTKLDDRNEVAPIVNPQFSLFTIDDATARKLEQMPPLTAPFGDYRTTMNMQSALTGRIGTVNSGQPLLAFGQRQSLRYGFVVGEGLWRWRLADYQANGSHQLFDELLSKAVVYTSLRINKDHFRVNAKGIYRENEPVVIEAELYNDNYEPVNIPDVALQVGDLKYQFNRSGNGYMLNLGTLSPGTYRYSASTTFNGKHLAASGTFVVEDLMLEELTLKADHATMNTLAVQSGGVMLSPADIGQLPSLLAQRDDIKTVMYSNTRYAELLRLPLVFVLLLLLLGGEWVLRKYNGAV